MNVKFFYYTFITIRFFEEKSKKLFTNKKMCDILFVAMPKLSFGTYVPKGTFSPTFCLVCGKY